MRKPIRVGVIGGGIWGTFHLRAAKEFEREGKLYLAAIAEKDEATATKQAEKYEINKYSKLSHLLKIHSWAPFYVDYEELADNPFSTNILSSLILKPVMIFSSSTSKISSIITIGDL